MDCRCEYRHAHGDRNAHTHSNAHGDGDAYRDGNAHPNEHIRTRRNRHANAHRNRYRHRHRDAHSHYRRSLYHIEQRFARGKHNRKDDRRNGRSPGVRDYLSMAAAQRRRLDKSGG